MKGISVLDGVENNFFILKLVVTILIKNFSKCLKFDIITYIFIRFLRKKKCKAFILDAISNI